MNQTIEYSGYDGVSLSILKVKKKKQQTIGNTTAYLNSFWNKTEMSLEEGISSVWSQIKLS